MKVFITTGSVASFNSLIRAADDLARLGVFGELAHGFVKNAVAQIGVGEYLPFYMKWFRFVPSLEQNIRDADLIICHCGFSTICESLVLGKKVIAIHNPRTRAGNLEIAEKFRDEGYILLCRSVSDLGRAVEDSRGFTPKAFVKQESDIPRLIVEYLGGLR